MAEWDAPCISPLQVITSKIPTAQQGALPNTPGCQRIPYIFSSKRGCTGTHKGGKIEKQEKWCLQSQHTSCPLTAAANHKAPENPLVAGGAHDSDFATTGALRAKVNGHQQWGLWPHPSSCGSIHDLGPQPPNDSGSFHICHSTGHNRSTSDPNATLIMHGR